MQSLAIFPLFYLPPVSYFSALKDHNYQFFIEKQEHFVKQTYRSRASIASPDGVLDLMIPVVKGSKFHTCTKDVKISYDFKWQRLHWLSLQTCYRSSAYFEFYEDEIAQFYEKRYEYLFDYNVELTNWILLKLKQNALSNFTEEFEQNIPTELDYRGEFKKRTIHLVETKPYFQVFSDRNQFIPNLSIVDLLFNQGPQAKAYL